MLINKLVECKNDIRNSIERRGIEVTGGMSIYADLIYLINGSKNTLDFSSLNYDSRMKSEACECVNRIVQRHVNSSSYNLITFPTKEFCESELDPFETNRAVVAVPVFTPYGNIGWYNSGIFAGQHIITHIPRINTINVSVMKNAFYECFNLKYVELLDCSSCTNASGMFEYAGTVSGEIHFEGFYNLGMQEDFVCDWMFDTIASISRESMLNIFNNLYDRASAGYSTVTLKFGSNVLSQLSDSDIAIATNKGWTISSY